MPKLSMILNTVGKTINLAKSNTYQIPKKPPLNSLIFEKLPEGRCGEKITHIKGPTFGKPVKICTKEELQTLYCPPPPCEKAIRVPTLSFGEKFGWLLKNLVKALLVGGIVYYTYKEGFWSDGFHTACIFQKYFEYCPPEPEDDLGKNEFADLKNIVIEEPEPCGPALPDTEMIMYKMGRTWNSVVIFMFWLIFVAPLELYNHFFGPEEQQVKKRVKKKVCPTEYY